MIKKIFISQPIQDKSDNVIFVERKCAMRILKNVYGENVEILNIYSPDFSGNELDFLGKEIAMLAQADIVYFTPGWRYSQRCRIEYICAKEYKIDTLCE